MDKEKHIAELEKILKELYPLLPLEGSDCYTIKDLAQEFYKEAERRLNSPPIPGIENYRSLIFLDTLEALKMDKKGYLQKVHDNIHPENRDWREDLKRAINNE